MTTELKARRSFVVGLSASALLPLTTLTIQLGSIPLLLHSWGARMYGDWILLAALPSYLALSDLGFGSASGSDMAVRVAAGDREGALRTFQSSWLLTTAVSMAAILLASLTLCRVPWHRWLHLATISDARSASVITVLGLFAVLGQQLNVLESGYRCSGNFALGTAFLSTLRLVEAGSAAVAGIVMHSLLWTALAYLFVRTAGLALFAWILRRKSPWLHFGIRRARISTMRALAGPSSGFLLMAAAEGLSLQGFTLVVGALRGPADVAAFSTARTLTRALLMLSNTIGYALRPELSAAFGAGDLLLARVLHRDACRLTLTVCLPLALLLSRFGPVAHHIWTRDTVGLDPRCFLVLVLTGIFGAMWYTSIAVPMANNTHLLLTGGYVLINAMCLTAVLAMAPYVGLVGIAAVLLAGEIAMLCCVLPATLRRLSDTFREFVAALGKLDDLYATVLSLKPDHTIRTT